MYTMKYTKSKNCYTYRSKRSGMLFACLAALLLAVSICSAKPSEKDDAKASKERLIELAKSDQVELLEWSMELYSESIRDYSAVLHKQERVNGALKKPQEIAFWFREEPYSLLMKWEKNAGSIDKLLYVEGMADGHMFVHPTGAWSWIKSVKRKPKCKEALNGCLRTADEFGFYKNMHYIHQVMAKADRSGQMRTKYLGQSKVYGRKTIGMEAFFSGRNNEYSKIVMHFDQKYILPLALAFYGRDGKLHSSYAFSDLKLNPGLSEEVFCKKKNKM